MVIRGPLGRVVFRERGENYRLGRMVKRMCNECKIPLFFYIVCYLDHFDGNLNHDHTTRDIQLEGSVKRSCFAYMHNAAVVVSYFVFKTKGPRDLESTTAFLGLVHAANNDSPPVNPLKLLSEFSFTNPIHFGQI